MMHYVKSSDKRRRGELEQLAQKNAGTKSKHLRKLPANSNIVCVCVCTRVRVCMCMCVVGVCVTIHLLVR